MKGRKWGKALLFPPVPVIALLLPGALAGMVYGMVSLGEAHPVTIGFDALAFYSLTVFCLRLPELIRWCKTVPEKNKYLRRWLNDPRLRMNVTVGAGVVWNGAYGALQLGLGIYHRSAWFYTLGAYYGSLAIMRLSLVKHTLRHAPGEQMHQELKAYRRCGWTFLWMNLALSGMLVLRIHKNQVTAHHPVTTIAMATYTFTTLTLAVVNVIKYRKYNSPVMWAAKAISLASACVSLLSLEDTMLVTFGGEKITTRQLFLAASGGGISLGIVVMALAMILGANKKIKALERENGK